MILEEAATTIFTIIRSKRPLTGEDSLLVRSIGEDKNSIYNDRRRGYVKTELAEFDDALEQYDKNPDEENSLELLLEAGDMLFQKAVLNVFYKDEDDYDYVTRKINHAISYIAEEVEKRGFTMKMVEQLAEIKYSSRAERHIIRKKTEDWGMEAKHPEIEHELCLDALRKYEG